jgi:POT family proton-dependent oligopeptide transporter
MAKPKYPTQPVDTDGMPPGIPFIIGNEAAERFCFYGMRTILVVFMTRYLLSGDGVLAPMNEGEAKGYYHTFVAAAYFLPFFGAILSDALWGKFRTILWLSLVYCLGSFMLAATPTRFGLLIGLSLIAIGSGGIKPCVSANVGDQFGERNKHLLPKAFSWFYFSINFGSFFSTMLTPFLLEPHSAAVQEFLAGNPGWWDAFRTIDPNTIFAFIESRCCPAVIPLHSPRLAFGLPGVFMLLATLLFWLGRHKFVRVPPAGMDFVRETFGPGNLRLIKALAPLFLAEAVFWSLWDQTGSAWVLQAEKMDLHFLFEWKASQVQAVNPLFILTLIPVCTYLLYPGINRFFPLTPLRKIGLGMFLTVAAFLLTAWIESRITAGGRPNIGWQFVSFIIISFAEIMVSITFLEFAYTQAPKRLKSLIMSLNLMSISLGNGVTALINFFIQNQDGTSKLPGAVYYLFFAGMMLLTAVGFIFIAGRYREQKVAEATV